ncbi:MAG: TonB-dependent receptor [candidate division KSB1 bacterium]|nr:TonB-dependent receptor [candidate division KSB1 bacterium]
MVDMIKKLLLGSALLSLTALPLFAGTTGILEGFVRDKANGTPLPGVNIMVVQTGQGTVTTNEGYFRIHNIPAGTYEVRIFLIGYQTVTFRAIVIQPDLASRLNVEMTEAAINMGEIVVHAERPLIQRDVTGTIHQVQQEKIGKLPVDKFQEVVGLQAGTTIEGNIRGGKSREVAYLVDGLAVQDLVSGGLGIEVPKSAIQQLNIKTGGFDAEYGNALSGVVNVVTRSGSNAREYFVRADKDDLFGGKQVSKTNEVEFYLSGPIRKDQLYYFFANNFYLTDTRWWQDFQNFFDSPVRTELHSLARLDWQPSPTRRLALQALYSMQNWRDYEFSWRFNLSGLPPRRQGAYRTALTWSHTVSKNAFYSIHLSHSLIHSRIGESDPAAANWAPYQYDFFLQYIVSGSRLWAGENFQHLYNVKADFTALLPPRHSLKAGAEFNYYDVQAELRKVEPQLTYFGKPLLDQPLLNFSSTYHYLPRSGSVYVQDKIEFGYDGSVASLGLRFDFLDPRASRPAIELIPVKPNEFREEIIGFVPARMKYKLSPRFGFSAPLTPRSSMFVNYGHYFQYPLFDYLYTGLDNVKFRGGVNVLRGNPDLQPERTQALEMSVRYILEENIVATLTYFKKETKNQIDTKTFVPTNSRIAGDYGFAEYVNNPYALASGLELVVTRDRGSWVTGTISYTLMKAEGLSEYENQGINYAQWGFPVFNRPFYLSWDQRHTLKADFLFDLPKGLNVNLLWQFHTGRPFTYYPSKDGFTPDFPDRPFLPNTGRMRSINVIDLYAAKDFDLRRNAAGAINERKFTVYVDVRNLLNAKNVRWVDSSGRIGGELGDPSAYYSPRRTAIGIRAIF